MTRQIFLTAFCLLGALHASAQSPYAGEQERSIKALSDQRVAGLLAGRGLGYAKAAELNGYPGPKHVLELADELSLSDRQRSHAREIFQDMQARASKLGRHLVEAEAELDRAFGDGGISSGRLEELVAASARIEGELRAAHLQAHLVQADLLDDEQVARYMRLRGYGEHDGTGSRHEHHH